MSKQLGNLTAPKVDKAMLAEYRAERAKEIKLNTVNHEHTFLCALFHKLISLGQWGVTNKLSGVSKFQLPEYELTYLALDEVKHLFDSFKQSRNPDVELVAEICISTGARWGEVETLEDTHIKHDIVQYVDTKTGIHRWVSIAPEIQQKLAARCSDHKGRLFVSCHDAFHQAIERSGIVLPEGQLTYVLRHCFATHYLAEGGDIRTLAKSAKP